MPACPATCRTIRRAGTVAAAGDACRAGVDPVTQNCMTCHNGGSLLVAGSCRTSWPRSPRSAIRCPPGNNFHDAGEAAVAQQQSPRDLRRLSQPACDRTRWPPLLRLQPFGLRKPTYDRRQRARRSHAVLIPAVNQYENCLRCHGTSTGKQRLAFGYLAGADGFSPDPLKSFRNSPRRLHRAIQ